ncbi:MAG: hypothetical protein WBA68_01615 [Alteraurantiacibacter sp.]
MTLRFLPPATLPLLCLAATAAAQEMPADPYAACVAMEGDAERLACFDATHAAQQVVIADAVQQAEEQREVVFGFREEDAVIEDARESDAALAVTVAEVLQGQRRTQVLLMDNGQLWREIDGSTLRNRVREGWSGEVTRHWSGAYEIRFEGRSGYLRVARMR